MAEERRLSKAERESLFERIRRVKPGPPSSSGFVASLARSALASALIRRQGQGPR